MKRIGQYNFRLYQNMYLKVSQEAKFIVSHRDDKL
jgi:hypothetical protein